MRYEFDGLTDVGRVRANNEDSIRYDGAAGVAVLADGMGGYNAGEVAADMATSIILADLQQCARSPGEAAPPAREALQNAIARANLEIFQSAEREVAHAGMGTTVIAAWFRGPKLWLGHVGDSRCYRWRRHQLVQITRDHSLLQEQLDAGLISPEEAAVADYRNLVTRALGVSPEVEIDIAEHPVEAGDLYLLCSDGLTDMLTDMEIAQMFRAGAELSHLAHKLVAAANARGGRDNISVMLVRARAERPPQGLVAHLR